MIHVWNPYYPRARSINFERPVIEWVQRIYSLLEIHYVRLVDSGDALLVVLNNPDGKVHAYYAAGIETTEEFWEEEAIKLKSLTIARETYDGSHWSAQIDFGNLKINRAAYRSELIHKENVD